MEDRRDNIIIGHLKYDCLILICTLLILLLVQVLVLLGVDSRLDCSTKVFEEEALVQIAKANSDGIKTQIYIFKHIDDLPSKLRSQLLTGLGVETHR